MDELPLHDGKALSGRLRQLKPGAAEATTQMFLEIHPDWLVKYGERARKFGIEDAQYHIDFLAGAVEANSIQAFVEYCVWAAELLESRGIARNFLVENLAQVESALSSGLSPEEQAVIALFIEAGRLACTPGNSGSDQSSTFGSAAGPVSPIE
jgi:hypothetical protein